MRAVLVFLVLAGALAVAACRHGASALTPTLTLTPGNGLPELSEQSYGPRANAMAELPDGSMAFGTNSGLTIWRNGKSTIYTVPKERKVICDKSGCRYEELTGLPNNRVRALLAAQDGTLWIGTENGLARLHRGRLENVSQLLPATWHREDMTWLPSEGGWQKYQGPLGYHSVSCLLETADGRLAVGTHNGGLIISDRTKETFRVVHRAPDMNQWVTGIAEEPDGALVFAVCHEGIFRYDGRQVTPFGAFPAWEVPAGFAPLCRDQEGSLWLGTHHGLWQRSPNGAARFYSQQDALPDDGVDTLRVDRLGRLWGFGAEVAVRQGDTWQYPSFGDHGELRPHDILLTRAGDLWLAAWGGIVVCNPAVVWRDEPLVTSQLRQAKIRVVSRYPGVEANRYIAKDRVGRVWLAVAERLFRYDGVAWTELSDLAPEEDRYYRFVRADSRGRILVGTDCGLLVYDGDAVVRYLSANSRDVHGVSDMTEAADGTIYVASTAGLYALVGKQWTCLDRDHAVHAVAVDDLGRVWFGDWNRGLCLYQNGKVTELAGKCYLVGLRVRQIEPRGNGVVRVTLSHNGPRGEVRQQFDCDGETARLVPAAPPSAP